MKKKDFYKAIELLLPFHTTGIMINYVNPNGQVNNDTENPILHLTEANAGAARVLFENGYSFEFHRKNLNADIEVIQNVTILRYATDIKGVMKPAAMVYIGKSAKAAWRYYFGSAERREQMINETLRNQKQRSDYKEQKKQEKKEFKPSLKVGDILQASWGYDQTNVDFYKVLAVQNKTGIFQEIGQNIVTGSEGFMSCNVIADPDKVIGEPFRKQILIGNRIKLNSFTEASLYDGKPTYKSWYA